MKKLPIIGIILVMSAAIAMADTADDIAGSLYMYYQADMDEDIDAMMDILHTGFTDDESQYRQDMRKIYTSMFETYDTKSFELTDADIFYAEEDARVFYHLNAEVEAETGKSYTIDNAFVAVLHDDDGWKVSYVMPRMQYDSQKMAKTLIDNEIRDHKENTVEHEEKGDGLLGSILNFFKELVLSLFEEEAAEEISEETEPASIYEETVENVDEESDTEPEEEEPAYTDEELQEAYTEYIQAYNRMTDLMTSGKGDTPEAQQAYEDYKNTKSKYEMMTNPDAVPEEEEPEEKQEEASSGMGMDPVYGDYYLDPSTCDEYCYNLRKKYTWRSKWGGVYDEEKVMEEIQNFCKCPSDYYEKHYKCMEKYFDSCYSTCMDECASKGTYTYKNKDYEFECDKPKINCASWCDEDYCQGR